MSTEQAYQVGDRVERLTYPEKRVLYIATVVDVKLVEDVKRGQRVKSWMYRLSNVNGEPSPVWIKANGLRPVEDA